VKFLITVVWLLFLTWLTHTFASPQWRSDGLEIDLLTHDQMLEASAWTLHGPIESVDYHADQSITIERKLGAWTRMTRDVSLPPNTTLLRLKASLQAEFETSENISLFPPPVLHLKTPGGSNPYPFVSRPMFFQRQLLVDELIELDVAYDSIEVGLIAPRMSDWRYRSVSLMAATEHWRYPHSVTALMALWGLSVLWLVVKAWRRAWLPTMVVLGVLATVLVGVLSSSTQIVRGYGLMAEWASRIGGTIGRGQFSSVMQFGHVSLFAALSFIALLFHKRWRLSRVQVLTGILVIAVATEALQRHVFGRSPDVQDLVFDGIGILVGTAAYLSCQALFRISKRISARSKA